jgi:hypothetical protein
MHILDWGRLRRIGTPIAVIGQAGDVPAAAAPPVRAPIRQNER